MCVGMCVCHHTQATSWAKSLADEYEQQVRGWYHELDKLREKLLEQSCVDLGLVLGQHTLEVMRRYVYGHSSLHPLFIAQRTYTRANASSQACSMREPCHAMPCRP